MAVARRILASITRPWSDRRAELTLGAVSLLIAAVVIAMITLVAVRAWPTLAHNGLSFLGSGGELDRQIEGMLGSSNPSGAVFHVRLWPVIYGTILTAGLALALGLPLALFASIFIVELAPASLRRVAIPVIRLLASVPSVIYGLIGILVLVPFIGNDLVTEHEKLAVAGVIELTGQGVAVSALILTVMITPIMVALICEALAAVPRPWREGAVALGLNPLRATLAVSVRAARPAIAAAAVLATARAIGEAVVIQMVSGGRSYAPNLSHGPLIFLWSPLRTLAGLILADVEGVNAPALRSTLYACALLLLFSAFVLSIAGYLIKLPLRRYQTT